MHIYRLFPTALPVIAISTVDIPFKSGDSISLPGDSISQTRDNERSVLKRTSTWLVLNAFSALTESAKTSGISADDHMARILEATIYQV